MNDLKLKAVGSMNSSQPSWRIVREWDEIIASKLNVQLKSESRLSRFVKCRIIDNSGLASYYNALKPSRKDLTLRFIMGAETRHSCFVDKNTIPVIIDFWIEEKDLLKFYQVYKQAPLVLVTNKEVYRFLKEHDCPLNVEHWALSYPDQYALKNNLPKKEYEFCIFGRPNPFFIRLLDRYCVEHSDFTYILNNGDINNRHYINKKGEIIAKDNGRSSYLEMISKTKVSCYTTPGVDESKKDTNTFNQVTPRVFEMLCNGCMVIGHYPLSDDTEWYKLNSVVPQIDTYEEFENVLNSMRKSEFDYNAVMKFMEMHYTSRRCVQLKEILDKYGIKY